MPPLPNLNTLAHLPSRTSSAVKHTHRRISSIATTPKSPLSPRLQELAAKVSRGLSFKNRHPRSRGQTSLPSNEDVYRETDEWSMAGVDGDEEFMQLVGHEDPEFYLTETPGNSLSSEAEYASLSGRNMINDKETYWGIDNSSVEDILGDGEFMQLFGDESSGHHGAVAVSDSGGDLSLRADSPTVPGF